MADHNCQIGDKSNRHIALKYLLHIFYMIYTIILNIYGFTGGSEAILKWRGHGKSLTFSLSTFYSHLTLSRKV